MRGAWVGSNPPHSAQYEFGFFVDHFTFIAGLLFAAAYGPGRVAAMRLSLMGKRR